MRIIKIVCVLLLSGFIRLADASAVYGYDAAYGQAFLFNNGLGDLSETNATVLTSTGSGQWESIFSDGINFYGYDSAYGQAFLFNNGLGNLSETNATVLTSTGSGQWESIFSDGINFYGYDSAYGQAFLFSNGLDNLTETNATVLTSFGSGQWESVFSQPVVVSLPSSMVPEPNAIVLLLGGLFVLTGVSIRRQKI